MKKETIGILTVTLAGLAFGDTTMTSATFDLDTTPGVAVYGSCSVNYSPSWIDGVDVTGASVAIYETAHAGTEQSVKTLLYRASADESGTFTYVPAVGTPDAVRLEMSVERDGNVLGTLSRDMAFGARGTKAGFAPDSRAVAVQEVADQTGKVPVAFDVAWREGAASAVLSSVNRTREKRGPVVVTTNTVATLTGSGVREWTVPRVDGFDRLLLTFLDGDGNPLGETLESAWFEKSVPLGLLVILR